LGILVTMTARPTSLVALALGSLILLAACGDDDADGPPADDSAEVITYRERMTKLDDAITVWDEAETIAVAHAAAEAAANLVVGPGGPDFGDRDGNGGIDGETAHGLLPGLDGTPPGVAELLDDNQCILVDVLGGSWDDPAGRWADMDAAIAVWTPESDTMLALASQPMRIAGWATITLESDSLDGAHALAGAAATSLNISIDALDC